MKALEEETRQLRKLVAQQALDNQALKAVVEKSGDLFTTTASCGHDEFIWCQRAPCL